MEGFKIFSGNSNLPLAEAICKSLEMPLGKVLATTFSDGEHRIKFLEDIRSGGDIFIIQSLDSDKAIMECFVMLDAAQRSSASKVIAVLTYFGYGRQERKTEPRVPISIKLLIDLLITAGADRFLTLDLHSGAIQGCAPCRVPFDNLFGSMILAKHYVKVLTDEGINVRKDVFAIAPDYGSVERTFAIAKRLGVNLKDIFIISKMRPEPNKSQVFEVIGNTKRIKGRVGLVIDDMADTLGTLKSTAQVIGDKGGAAVYAACVHGVLSGPAIKRLMEMEIIKKLWISDTILLPKKKRVSKIEVVSIAHLLAEAIRRINRKIPLSELFD